MIGLLFLREEQAIGKYARAEEHGAKKVGWGREEQPASLAWEVVDRSTLRVEPCGCTPDPTRQTQTNSQEKQSQRTQVEAAYFIHIPLVKNNFTY